jgi:hypothetical protein
VVGGRQDELTVQALMVSLLVVVGEVVMYGNSIDVVFTTDFGEGRKRPQHASGR